MVFILDSILNKITECDGGDAGGIGGDIGNSGGISSSDVLGPDGKFENGEGCLGKDDFHVPFPVMPCLFRWANPSKSTKNKKKKKTTKIAAPVSKNPYAKGIKTIIAEDDTNVVKYVGLAKEEFNRIVGNTDQAFVGVLQYNDQFKLAWMIRKDGILHLYKPMNMGNFWTVYASSLLEDGMIMLDYKAGKYPTERAALDAIYKAAKAHEQKLQECLKKLNKNG